MADPVAAALHRPGIGAHRLLGSGRSAALIRPDGEVDWWCAPEVDSTPVLWSLLDAHGAAARWNGMRLSRWSGPPAAPVTHTVLRLRHTGDEVECRDALVDDGCGTSLVRLVRARSADLDLTHELDIGGFDQPWGRWDGRECSLDNGVKVVVKGGHTARVGRTLRTVLTGDPGQWAALVISVDTVLDADAGALVDRLGDLEADAESEAALARLPRHHPERAADALAVLEACTYRPTGAVVAAPTTSLPEAPGADRQFDYRYTWLRDASLAISVAALLGRRNAAESYLDFLRTLAPDGTLPDSPMTDVRGGPVPDERELEGVAGWAASLPVRVGNGAAGQVQHDAWGLLAEGISVYLQTGGSLDPDIWRLLSAVADRAAEEDHSTSNGIWELRTPRQLVSADIGRWLCLDRAVWIARGWRPRSRRRRWKTARDEIRARVLAALDDEGGLPQTYDGKPAADASALMAVVFGMIGSNDPRADRLVTTTLRRLGAGPWLYRYEPGGHDGFSGTEGAFLPVCWWAVAALAIIGKVDEARDRADEMCAALPRLLAEEIDPTSGESLGNAPLVWSHAEAARAMYVLDAADLRRRRGAVVLWAWRIGRYLQFRFSERVGH